MRVRSACVGLACAAGLAATASATTLPLAVYENDDNADLTGLSLWVDIESNLAGTVDFTFRNTSTGFNSIASVANIYFENVGAGQHPIGNGSVFGVDGGVSFAIGGAPPDPANPSDPTWRGNLSRFSAANPAPSNGINSGESLTLRFDLMGGATLGDVVDALTMGDFRIAQHVISVGSDNESSVWTITDTVVIPLPGAAGLGALGLGLVAIRRRR